MHGIRIVVLVVLIAATWAFQAPAQEAFQACGAGDATCYQRQYEAACAMRGFAISEACSSWIAAVKGSARPDDRAAGLILGVAHMQLAMLHPDAATKARNREDSRQLYRELVESDPTDADALLGLSTATEDVSERIEILRRAARLKPESYLAEIFAETLTRRGRPEDLLEAAESLERLYELSNKIPSWGRTAGRAANLFEQAGNHERARNLRERLRRDFNIEPLLSELERLGTTDPARTEGILKTLCDSDTATGVGAEYCLRGLDIALAALPISTDRLQAQRIADSSALIIMNVSAAQHSHLFSKADQHWAARISRQLDFLAQHRIESAVTLRARAQLEPDWPGRIPILERAMQLAPGDYAVLEPLAMIYRAQRRFDEALAMYVRMRNLPTTPPALRQRIDENIQSLERARKAAN